MPTAVLLTGLALLWGTTTQDVRASIEAVQAPAAEACGIAVCPVDAEASGTNALTREEVYGLALEVSGSERWAREAVEVAWCESRFRPGVWGDGGRAYGLLQVHAQWWGAVPRDARGQLAQGYTIWTEHGWRPWTCGRGS